MSQINVGPALLSQTPKGFKVHVGPLAFDVKSGDGATLLMHAMATQGSEAIVAAASGPVRTKTVSTSKRSSSGRRERRSPEKLEAQMKAVVAFLKAHKNGAKVDELMKATKLERDELSGPIALGVSKKLISKKGQKRATTYFANGSGPSKPTAKKTKKSAKKSAPKSKPRAKAKSAKKAAPKKSASKHVNGTSQASAPAPAPAVPATA